MTSHDTNTDDRVYITAGGLEKLKEELDYLRTVRRTEVAELIQRAKELGDVTDSAQYDAAKEEQSFLEGRIQQIENQFSHASLIEEQASSDGAVHVGSKVTLTDNDGVEETWEIVGRTEADATNGRISNQSPVGRAILGKRKGDKVDVQTPAGTLTFSITSIG